MELMEVILTKENLNRAYKKVVANKGASGIDKVTVEELGKYIKENQEDFPNQYEGSIYQKIAVNKDRWEFLLH